MIHIKVHPTKNVFFGEDLEEKYNKIQQKMKEELNLFKNQIQSLEKKMDRYSEKPKAISIKKRI